MLLSSFLFEGQLLLLIVMDDIVRTNCFMVLIVLKAKEIVLVLPTMIQVYVPLLLLTLSFTQSYKKSALVISNSKNAEFKFNNYYQFLNLFV